MMNKIILLLSLTLTFNAYALNECGSDLGNNCWDCGKNDTDSCTAILDPISKKLTITGDGYMADYKGTYLSDPDFPVRPWGNDVTEVEISSGIKSIGEYAFYETKLTEITIPASVEKIGMGGVQSISTLESVTFEENSNLKWIGSGAFNSDKNLTNITLPEGLERIDTNAFNGSGIASIVLPDSVWSTDIGTTTPSVYGVQTKAFSGVPNVYCSEESRSKCEEYFNNPDMQFWWQGGVYPIKEKATLNINNLDGTVDTYQYETDGSIAIYRDGQVKSYKNKRIYTVEEATKLSKPTGNTFKIRYK